MGRNYAGILGLLAFALACLRGVLWAQDAQSTLLTATVGLFVCGAVGFVVGAIAERTVDEAVRGQLLTALETEDRRGEGSTTPRRTTTS